ncbi:MAG: ChaN family lipoprotein [Magnetococcales bacterium]|nr:ChaN family lipoprotein [Magnetococcales bacterium]
MSLRFSLGLLMIVVLTGCQRLVEPVMEAERWPVVSTTDGRKPAFEEMISLMEKARVVYLGEKHDNPHHHRMQRLILESLVARGRKPVIGFEFFSREETGLLLSFVQGNTSPMMPNRSADEEERALRRRLNWEHRPEWSDYFPLLALAKQKGLMVFGADLPTGVRSRMARVGLGKMVALEKRFLVKSTLENASYRLLMQEQFANSHCGMAGEGLLERLYQTWLARNEAMAESIVTMAGETPGEPVVVILGAGHTQYDMGVYERVAVRQPDWIQVNIGLREEGNSLQMPVREELAEVRRSFAPDHQYVWFTPVAEDPDKVDPCRMVKSK